MALAEIGYVIEQSVTGLLEAQAVGVTKDEARALLRPAAPPPPSLVVEVPAPAPAPAAPPARFGWAAFFGTQGWSSDATLVPDLGVDASVERASGVGLSVDAEVRRSFEIDAPQAKLSVAGGAAHLLLMFGRPVAGLGTWHLLLGPGVALDRVQATSSIPALAVTTPARTDVDLAFAARVRWDASLRGRLGAFAVAGADVTVAGRYTATIAGIPALLATSWPVRPTIFVGLVYGGP